MPELPEVETIRRTLEPHVVGRTVTGVTVIRPALVRYPDAAAFARGLLGRTILAARRRGKYLILPVGLPAGPSAAEWVVHLMMAGRLVRCPGGTPPTDPKQVEKTHVIVSLDSGDQLRYIDFRHLGRLSLVPPGDYRRIPGLERLGPDPFEVGVGEEAAGTGAPAAEATPGAGAPGVGTVTVGAPALDRATFLERLAGRRGRLKSLLLNQAFMAGVGNIYADEALFRAGLHPERRAETLSASERDRLYDAVVAVLAAALGAGGTTFSRYVDAEGRWGTFGEALAVYGKKGAPCPRCGRPIERIVIGGRSSHFCPACQPATGGGPRRRRRIHDVRAPHGCSTARP